jgi:hypothetical protein
MEKRESDCERNQRLLIDAPANLRIFVDPRHEQQN